jgi:hypothetical protein
VLVYVQHRTGQGTWAAAERRCRLQRAGYNMLYMAGRSGHRRKQAKRHRWPTTMVGGVKAKPLCSSDWRIPAFAGVSRAYWSACWMLHLWQTALMTWLQATPYRAGNFSHVNVNEDT